MVRSKGSSKGTPFERLICKQFSLWWTDGERDDVFWRTSNSGGRATVRKSLKNQHGDMTATDPIGLPLIENILIEIKRGYTCDTLQDVFDCSFRMKEQRYEKWFKKAEVDCNAAGIKRESWMLVIQRDRREALIVMPYNRWLSFKLKKRWMPIMNLWMPGRHVVMMQLDDFWFHAKIKHVRMLDA